MLTLIPQIGARVFSMPERGRPSKYGEPVQKRQFNFPESLSKQLNAMARARGEDVTKVLHDALRREIESPVSAKNTGLLAADLKRMLREAIEELKPTTNIGGIPVYRPVISDEGNIQLPILCSPPCGPWKAAIEEAESLSMSSEMARLLGVEPADFLVKADGISMVEAGIPDGSLVLMRPLGTAKPKRGDVVLVQAVTQSGEYVATVKTWIGAPKGIPDLRDGKGFPYEFPPDVDRFITVAVKRGLIAGG